jgi:hypothetical protein
VIGDCVSMNEKKPIKMAILIQKTTLLTTIMTYLLGDKIPRDLSHLKIGQSSKELLIATNISFNFHPLWNTFFNV